MIDEPVVTSMYDAELFGHWWFEGPWWFEAVFRRINENGFVKSAKAIDIADETISKLNGLLKKYDDEKSYLELVENINRNNAKNGVFIAQPATSSWGGGGYAEVWLNGKNDVIQPFLSDIASVLIDICKNGINRVKYPEVLNQGARELILAQSSDWPFMLTTGQAVSYAERRGRAHLVRAKRCILMAVGEEPMDSGWFDDISGKDNIFPKLDALSLYGKDIC